MAQDRPLHRKQGEQAAELIFDNQQDRAAGRCAMLDRRRKKARCIVGIGLNRFLRKPAPFSAAREQGLERNPARNETGLMHHAT